MRGRREAGRPSVGLLYELSSPGVGEREAVEASMARPLLKIQRYFRRKPVRFFSLILLYLTAGSLVFLHSGFVGGNFSGSGSGAGGGRGRDPLVATDPGAGKAASTARQEVAGAMSRVFREPRRHGRRYGPAWMKRARQDGQKVGGRGGDAGWNRALKGRNGKDTDDGRGGSPKSLPRPNHGSTRTTHRLTLFSIRHYETNLSPCIQIQVELYVVCHGTFNCTYIVHLH